MPWLWVIFLIVGIYVLVKAIQGIMDAVVWYREEHAYAQEQKRVRQERRQGHHQLTPPPLKERPSRPTRPPK